MSRPCPICQRSERNPAYAPFCSKRCADVDLQRWLSGGYVVIQDEGEDGTAPPLGVADDA